MSAVSYAELLREERNIDAALMKASGELLQYTQSISESEQMDRDKLQQLMITSQAIQDYFLKHREKMRAFEQGPPLPGPAVSQRGADRLAALRLAKSPSTPSVQPCLGSSETTSTTSTSDAMPPLRLSLPPATGSTKAPLRLNSTTDPSAPLRLSNMSTSGSLAPTRLSLLSGPITTSLSTTGANLTGRLSLLNPPSTGEQK